MPEKSFSYRLLKAPDAPVARLDGLRRFLPIRHRHYWPLTILRPPPGHTSMPIPTEIDHYQARTTYHPVYSTYSFHVRCGNQPALTSINRQNVREEGISRSRGEFLRQISGWEVDFPKHEEVV